MLNPKYYPTLTLAEAIKEDLIHSGEIVDIYDFRGTQVYHGPVEKIPKKVKCEYVNFIRDRLAANGCKLYDRPTECIFVSMQYIRTNLQMYSAENLLKLYDQYHTQKFIGPKIRAEILRRLSVNDTLRKLKVS